MARYRHPIVFYALATAIPWALWLIAGRVSFSPDQTAASAVMVGVLSLAGLVAPAAVGAVLIAREGLWPDVVRRLTDLRIVPGWAWLAAVGLLPAALLVATAVSVAFGGSPEQFQLRGGASFTSGVLPAWLTLTLAPVLEELGWHGYGTDALASRLSVWRTSLLFAAIWFFWHVPLATIRGYYQAQVVELGWLASANFALSVVPFVLLMNWVYYRSGRSILVAVVFHLTANVGNELWLTDPDTKAIQTGILLVVCAAVLWKDKALFFTRPARPPR